MNYPSDKQKKKVVTFPIGKSEFIPETGFSYVTIITPYGQFTGTAQVHPDDLRDLHFSSFSGQGIAHTRAYIEYFKYRKRLYQFSCKELKTLWATSKKKNATSYAIKMKIVETENKIAEYKEAIDKYEGLVKSKIKFLDEYYKAKNK